MFIVGVSYPIPSSGITIMLVGENNAFPRLAMGNVGDYTLDSP